MIHSDGRGRKNIMHSDMIRSHDVLNDKDYVEYLQNGKNNGQ